MTPSQDRGRLRKADVGLQQKDCKDRKAPFLIQKV